jgi:NAD(P)-dependent dehydrogenase (short-subunit alcohol dehydrogenase family)
MSNLSFKGQTVVITGAGGGLGKSFVSLFHSLWGENANLEAAIRYYLPHEEPTSL